MSTYSYPRPPSAPAVSRSVLLVVTSITSLQVGAVLAVVAFDDLAPITVACIRMLLAAVFLIVVTRPRDVRARLRDDRGRRLAVFLGVALAVMHVCIYEAIARVPIGLATTLEAFGPLAFAALLSLRRNELLWVGLALTGVALAAQPSGTGPDHGHRPRHLGGRLLGRIHRAQQALLGAVRGHSRPVAWLRRRRTAARPGGHLSDWLRSR